MTNQQDVSQAIEDTLFSKGADGKTRFGRELDEHIDGRVGRWLLGGGFLFIFTITGFVWWAAQQEAKINEIDRRVDDNADAIQLRLDDISSQLTEVRSILIDAIKQ